VACLGLAVDVVDGCRVVGHPDQCDSVQGVVGLAIAAAREPIPLRLTRGGGNGRHPTQGGEGGLVVSRVGVVAGGDEQLAGAREVSH
jgi:hypothetical protein